MSSPRLLSYAAFTLTACLLLSPALARAQTLDSGVGIGPSQQLSTPPDSDPINRPGAMQRAVKQRRANAMQSRSRQGMPATTGSTTAPR